MTLGVCKPLLIPLKLCVYVVPFLRYSASKNDVTLKPGVGVVQGHWIWRRSTDHIREKIRLSIGRHCKYSSMLYHFRYLALNNCDLEIWVICHWRSFTLLLLLSWIRWHKSALTDHATQENHVINWSQRRWSTESQSVLPDGSKRPYTPERKDNRPWTVMRAATNWATHTTASLIRRLPVVSRTGRTEYQLLLMKPEGLW